MNNNELPFSAADILLPKGNFYNWSTIACDQFTSEEAYWDKVKAEAGKNPSCLNITLPEVYLEKSDVEQRIANINATMQKYLENGIFEEYKDALIYVERTIADGRVRKGIVGKFDLSAYDYNQGSSSMIRPTEGTVLSRIPARVKIRKDAGIELPHVMILIDDKKRTVIENIDTSKLTLLYDFDLMLDGGHLKGYLLDKNEQDKIFKALNKIKDDNLKNGSNLVFAVGDGNHSLATAKACAEVIGTDEAQYALAEIVNIHDEALDFEPIYRVVFNVDTKDMIASLKASFAGCSEKKVEYVTSDENGEFYVDGLETDVLQKFIDKYVSEHSGATVDYIHGEASTKALAAKKNAIGFIFDGITKDELFPYVSANGPLPRKTFSMGLANDKRYYMEARKIRK